MSTVLSAKNGVITEERFQKMSWAQWFFHFLEVTQNEKNKLDRENLLFEKLIDQIEAAGLIAHPKTDRQSVVNMIEDRKLQREGGQTLEEVMEFLQENDELFPQTITVNPVLPDKESKYFLPKATKEKLKPGIFVGEN